MSKDRAPITNEHWVVHLHQTEAAKTPESAKEVLNSRVHTRAAKIVQALLDYRSKTGHISQQMLSLWRDLPRGTRYDIKRALQRGSVGQSLWGILCSEWGLDERSVAVKYQDNCDHDLSRSKTCTKCGWSP